MGILSWIVIGLLVGLVTSSLSKSRGFRKLTIMVISLFGAIVGWLNVAFLYRVPGAVYDLNWLAMIAALVGSILAVALFGLLRPQKSPAVQRTR